MRTSHRPAVALVVHLLPWLVPLLVDVLVSAVLPEESISPFLREVFHALVVAAVRKRLAELPVTARQLPRRP